MTDKTTIEGALHAAQTALEDILYGTLLDELNRSDDGLGDCYRELHVKNLAPRLEAAKKALELIRESK